MLLAELDELLDKAALEIKQGTIMYDQVFECFRRFERTIGLACPQCGHADLDAGIWDDAGIPEAVCQNEFHSVNRGGSSDNF